MNSPADREHTSRLKVLYVVPGKHKSGSIPFVHDEISRVQNAGVLVKKTLISGGTSPVRALKDLIALSRDIGEFQPDIVHAEFGTLTCFLAALSVCSAPLVVTFRGSDLQPSSFDGRIRNLFQFLMSQFGALRASRIICVSASLEKRLWFGRKKTVVMPSGTDTSIFHPTDRNAARAALGWETGKYHVIVNGSAPVKRTDIAEKVVSITKERIPNIELHILAGDVPFSGMPAYLNAADCLLVTSDSEGSPNIVREALAVGLPIVSFDVGDVKARLSDKSGCYVVERSTFEMSKALYELLASSADCSIRQPNVDAEWDVSYVMPRLVQLYEDMRPGRLVQQRYDS